MWRDSRSHPGSAAGGLPVASHSKNTERANDAARTSSARMRRGGSLHATRAKRDKQSMPPFSFTSSSNAAAAPKSGGSHGARGGSSCSSSQTAAKNATYATTSLNKSGKLSARNVNSVPP